MMHCSYTGKISKAFILFFRLQLEDKEQQEKQALENDRQEYEQVKNEHEQMKALEQQHYQMNRYDEFE